MIKLAIMLMFLLAATSIYSLIIGRRNYMLTFIFTPILLVSSIFAGYTMYALQGTPIRGIPQGNVEVLWVEMAKPDILFLARPEEGGQPRYYVIVYNKQNKETMRRVQQAAENQGLLGKPVAVPGKFSKSDNQDETDVMEFTAPDRAPLPPKTKDNDANSPYGGLTGQI